jgi:glucosamine--fructose-6-phosphate aminotransferase (isomerizing)
MCGIVGYVGNNRTSKILYDSLKKLEYRGYDSYGFSVVRDGMNFVEKGVGKISDAKEISIQGNVGIAHSRWATHGIANEENAHPHTDCTGKISIVHNGIIDNYQELRKGLVSRGHTFKSQTDSEIIAHLIGENISLGFDQAVKKAATLLEGRFAIVAISTDSDSKLVGVRRGSPLILGVKKNPKSSEYFLASDIPAFLDHTKNVMYLDDNEMVVINRGVKFFNLETGDEVSKRTITIDWDAEQASKGDHPHFMIKEIMEQKDTILRTINQSHNEIMHVAEQINQAYGTFFTGCGTAGKVCMTAEYLFSKIANKHVNAVFSSEFPNYKHFLTEKTLLMPISQSGETADVLEAVNTAKDGGVRIFSLVNVMGSTLDRVSDQTFLINAGPEKSVASTKATTSQLALVTLFAYACANKLDEGKRLLMETSSKVNDMLNPRYEERIRRLAKKIHNQKNIYIIGRSLNFPIALESAIKIQEVSYIHAEGFAGGELKHGPLALIHEGVPCIVFVANDETKKDIISNAMEVKSRGGYIIGVSPESNEIFDYWIKVPDAGNASPIVNIIPVQILAYHLAILNGHNPDYPRNLSKSVTVK